MGNELVVRQQVDFDTLQRQAVALQASGYFKDGRDPLNKAQAITKVMAGAELGLPPFASMSGLHIIQGKPVLGSNLIATLVKNDPRYNYRVKQCDDAVCVIEWFEDGKSVGEAGFTMEEANAAQLTGKDNWKKYPSDMLFARAISRGARRFAPGIFGGAPVYTPDEMNADEDEEGFIVTNGNTPTITEEPDPSPEPEVTEGEYEEVSGKMVDIRASLEEREKPKVGDVVEAVSSLTGVDAQKVLERAADFDEWPKGKKVTPGVVVSQKGALKLFDWLAGVTLFDAAGDEEE